MEIARGTEALVSEADGGLVMPVVAKDLPYSYARDHGLLIQDRSGERLSLAMREGSDPSALLEVRGVILELDSTPTERSHHLGAVSIYIAARP